MFAPLMRVISIVRSEHKNYPKEGYAYVALDGTIYVHPKRYAEIEDWVYVLAHCLLHLGFNHFKERQRPDLWNIACNVYIAKFLDDFKLGTNPKGRNDFIQDLPITTEENLYEKLLENGVDKWCLDLGTGNIGQPDMLFERKVYSKNKIPDWPKRFAIGLSNAVSNAVNVAAGKQRTLASGKYKNSPAERARSWFISSYPLLGSLVSSFEVIEDIDLCQKMDISVAAVHIELQEIYINPAAGLTEPECKFVIAHEILHAGLRHDTRRQGRDPYLWNIACDYVINSWLIEMQIGKIPAIGMLYDPTLNNQSAESIYHIISSDLRRMRKLGTLRGIGKCDILEPNSSDFRVTREGVDLDNFYRRCLIQGLEYHNEQGRGLLPAGLIEEVKSLAHPPLSWDVELAQWFDDHFSPIEKIRSYARLSRRQFGNPDIPQPRYVPLHEADENRTFGVVLDTSGSMDRSLLARALGAIISYSLARDVSRVRLIFCDAEAYDQGYVLPEALYERVKIKGRGGTMLQPGINLLERADDFPKAGPILIITDGGCDKLTIRRDHAFLIPSYAKLPFVPKGKIFNLS
jgi:predicted metal-dependent peptidase